MVDHTRHYRPFIGDLPPSTGRLSRRAVMSVAVAGLVAAWDRGAMAQSSAPASGASAPASGAIAGPGGRALKLVVFGDSLVAGYQLPAAQAFPAQLEARLRALGHKVEVMNAGVSGDTTAAGLERLAWAVPDDADGVIVELGANDMLRGLSPQAARANLDKILGTIRARKTPVLIAGMRAATTLGDDYARAFDQIYPELAATHDALLYPFFLDGIALDPQFNLADGLHPNAKGVGVIVERILPRVTELLARMALAAKA